MVNWTQKEFDDFTARRQKPGRSAVAPAARPAGNKNFALGRLPAGTMNKTESAYAAHLAELQHAGEILWYKFEGVKLRLADNTFYTCDFAVLPKDGVLQMHECKGWMEEDANVKIKVAAATYPFRFLIVRVRAKKEGGGWNTTEIGNGKG